MKKSNLLFVAAAFTLALAVARPASASTVYGVDLRNHRFVTFDTASPGSQTVLASGFSTAYYGLDFGPGGSLLYGLNSGATSLDVLNPLNGSVLTSTALTGLAAGDNLTGLTISPTGSFYVTSSSGADSTLYSLNPLTGALTTIGNMGVALAIDIAINAMGQAYTIDIATDQLFSLNLSTGAATAIGAIGYNANFAQGMDFDDTTGTLYAAIYIGGGVVNFASLNLSTGAATAIPGITSGEYEIAIRPVPEPGTISMVVLGALCLGIGASRRSRPVRAN